MAESLQQRVLGALEPRPQWEKGDIICWRSTESAPVSIFVRFFADRACKVSAQGPYNPEVVEAMLREISPRDLPDAEAGQFATFSSSPVLRGTPFDLRVIVSPEISRGALSYSVNFLAAVTFTAFPAYRCEFTGDDTRDELAFRVSKVVRWSNWGRQPSPAISARFHVLKSGLRSTGGKRMGVLAWDGVERTLGLLAAGDGVMEMQNFERKHIRVEHVDGHFVVNAGGDDTRQLPDDGIVPWARVFVTEGLDSAKARG